MRGAFLFLWLFSLLCGWLVRVYRVFFTTEARDHGEARRNYLVEEAGRKLRFLLEYARVVSSSEVKNVRNFINATTKARRTLRDTKFFFHGGAENHGEIRRINGRGHGGSFASCWVMRGCQFGCSRDERSTVCFYHGGTETTERH
jgi:hypothetical protein